MTLSRLVLVSLTKNKQNNLVTGVQRLLNRLHVFVLGVYTLLCK